MILLDTGFVFALLTDCISFVIMDAYGITEALSVDDDFTHRFVARPGPPPKR